VHMGTVSEIWNRNW